MKRLLSAQKALPSNPSQALAALVAAWGERPVPELAELVSRFEAVHPPAPFEGTTAAFVAAAKKPDVMTLGGLARALAAPKTADTLARLSALRGHLDDPRVASALLKLLHDVPWTSNGARPVWTATFALLTRIADVRLLALVETLPAAWKFRENQRAWMQQHLTETAHAIATHRRKKPVTPLTDAERAQVTALERALVPPTRPTTPGLSREHLLANVYANPDDDGPRLVFADWLLERGDPWGEFITLQFKPERTKAELGREKALVARHQKAWLGALATVTLKDVTFRRGFPAVVVARFKGQRDVEQCGDAPEWATIEALSWSLPGASSADEARWQQHLPARARPKSMAVETWTLTRLLEASTPWPVERLEVTTHDVEVMRRFAASSVFPKVRELVVSSSFVPQLLASGWIAAVPSVTVKTHHGPPRALLDALHARSSLVIESRGALLRFSRGADGRLSTLHLVARPGPANRGWVDLKELAGAVTTFTSEGLSKAQHQALAQTLQSSAAPAVQRRIFLAAHPLERGWAVVDKTSFLVVDDTGAIQSELPINAVERAGFSRDGSEVACGWGRRLEWRDGRTGALLEKEQLTASLRSMDFSLDGRHLLVRTEQQLEVRHWPQRAVRWSGPAGKYPASPTCAALSPDGSVIVAPQADSNLRVMREGQRRATVTKGATYRQAITFLADGTCLIASRDDVLERFAVDDLARPLASWKVPEAFVLLPSPDGTKVAAGPLEATRDVQPVRVLHLETSKVTTLPGRLKALAWTRGSHGLLCSDGTALVVQRA